MGMKSRQVHAMNRFPGSKVFKNDQSIRVHSKDGELLAACDVDAHGCIKDSQKENGAKYPFSLSPLPKSARKMKLNEKGEIEKHEKHDERHSFGQKLADKHGYVPAYEEYEGLGYSIIEKKGQKDGEYDVEMPKEEKAKEE